MSDTADTSNERTETSRRKFIKNSSLMVASGAVASQLSFARAAHAFGSDEIRIGLVGCGGRGTAAAVQAMNTEGKTRLVAMGDVFGDAIQRSFRTIKGKHNDKTDVPQERKFVGLDAFQDVLDADIDLVILATPPGFRPQHVEAAINANKHVFMEKPVAVDAAGVRRVLKATEEAKKRNLALAVGLQRRHEPRYVETIKRLQDGAIGDIILARAYWNGGGVWVRPRQEKQTEMEYQLRNWYYFNWLCGDHIVEQHIHNLDVINWLMDGYPTSAQGQGGRQVRTGKDHGQIFDHHMVEFTYGDRQDAKMLSQCRHIRQTWSDVSEHAHGTQGWCKIGDARIYDSKGNVKWEYESAERVQGHQQEHHDLFAKLRQGESPNEGEYGALSTMTSIFGRMATYSGKMLKWDDAIASELIISPVDSYTQFDDKPPVLPDENGDYPVPMPGSTIVI